jgi:hypothetical protein
MLQMSVISLACFLASLSEAPANATQTNHSESKQSISMTQVAAADSADAIQEVKLESIGIDWQDNALTFDSIPEDSAQADEPPTEGADAETAATEEATAPAPKEEEPGFFSSHYPFGLNDNLEPEVEEDLVVLWLLMAMVGNLAGPLWIPGAIIKEEPSPEYKDDALWHWIWDLGLTAGSIPCMYSGFLCFGYGFLITAPLGIIHLIARSYYFNPVGVINLYDRHLKKARGKIAQNNQFLDDKFLRETSFASSGATMQMGY